MNSIPIFFGANIEAEIDLVFALEEDYGEEPQPVLYHGGFCGCPEGGSLAYLGQGGGGGASGEYNISPIASELYNNQAPIFRQCTDMIVYQFI